MDDDEISLNLLGGREYALLVESCIMTLLILFTLGSLKSCDPCLMQVWASPAADSNLHSNS